MKDVTFITGTIPGREHLLAEAVAVAVGGMAGPRVGWEKVNGLLFES